MKSLLGIVCNTKKSNAKLRKCENLSKHMNNEEGKIIYKDLSYKIFGICLEAHEILGYNCKEKQYCDLMEKLLIREKIKFEKEKNLAYYLGENKIGGNIVDFLIENKVLFDAKAKRFITREDYKQMKRYLEAANLKLGIIINFRDRRIKSNRIINSLAKE